MGGRERDKDKSERKEVRLRFCVREIKEVL